MPRLLQSIIRYIRLGFQNRKAVSILYVKSGHGKLPIKLARAKRLLFLSLEYQKVLDWHKLSILYKFKTIGS